MSSWSIPERLPGLAEGKIHVWRIQLDTLPNSRSSSRQVMRGFLDRAYAVLTAPERERAARMRAGRGREEFVAGRGCLRRLLGAMLECDPRSLVLETGEHGKPRLRAAEALAFNVAHSHGMALIALSQAGPVGIDVEYIDAAAELLDVARTAFHPEDLARIERAATQDARLAEFYRCWTRKEAVLKADGRGLTGELGEVAIGADGVVALTAAGWGQPSRYCVQAIDVGVTHMAALAVARETIEMNLFDLSPQSPLLFAE